MQYWSTQAKEHLLILKNAKQKSFKKEHKNMIQKSAKLTKRLQIKKSDLKLYELTLEESEQERLTALVESTSRELKILNSRLENLKQTKMPYKQPTEYKKIVAQKHKEIKQKLIRANQYVETLEPVMRNLINSELDKHENRMRYYLAQSRLAKARLYDSTLMNIKKVKSKLKKTSSEESIEAKNGEI